MFTPFQKIRNLEKKQRLIIFTVFGLIFLTTLAVSIFASYRYFKQKNQTYIDSSVPNIIDLDAEISLDPSQIKEEDQKTLNVLLAGYGGAGHQGGFLSDVIQIAHFDFEKKQITFISVPRDLYLLTKDNKGYKVNSLLSSGMSNGGGIDAGLAFMQKNISLISGLPIKYFIGIDFVGFQRTVGYELKSIEVEVSQTLEDPWYPKEGAQLDSCGYSPSEIADLTATYSGFELESKFKCRYEHLLFQKGKVTMEGHDALAYVRSRHSSSDYDRSRRQVEVLTAIRNKLFKLDALKNMPKFYEAMSKHVSTNLDLESAKYLAPLLANANEFTIRNVNLSPENVLQSSKSSEGAFITIPKAGMNNWGQMQSFIKNQI